MLNDKMNRHRNMVVGATVLSVVVAIFGIFVLFSSGVSFERYTNYRVYMQEAVSGLSPDASVEYNGVEVGTVKEIKIDQHNPHFVELLLNIKSSTLVTVDTVAMLKSKGLTGVNFISLSLRGNKLTPLLPQPHQPYAVIPTIPSFFMQIDAMVTHLNTVFANVKESFQALINKDDLETMRETYYSIDHIMTVLHDNSGNMSAIVTNTKISLVSLHQVLLYKDNFVAILKIRLGPFTYELLDRFEAVFSTLADAAKVLKENPSIIIRGIEPPPAGPGEKLDVSSRG